MYRWFALYASLEAAVEAYVDLLIDSMRYHPAWVAYQKDGDADKFLQAVCAAGYATEPAFKVEIAIEHQQNILHAVEMARAETERTQ
jgi:flagellum-specific peptidoglycan hydrolase FlgJ